MIIMSSKYIATNMVVCPNAEGRVLAFDVKGKPTVQRRIIVNFTNHRPIFVDPSQRDKQLYAEAVRKEMNSMGLTQFPYFLAGDPIQLTIKFVLPVPLVDIQGNHMRPGALPYPHHSGDVDNLLKFALDALEKTIYMDDTQIVKLEASKVYPTDVTDRVGWTELDFVKVGLAAIAEE
jgi:Holliday junction resolvase RusA-like endonuclease